MTTSEPPLAHFCPHFTYSNPANDFSDAEINALKQTLSDVDQFLSKYIQIPQTIQILFTKEERLVNIWRDQGIIVNGRTHSDTLIAIIVEDGFMNNLDAVFEVICHETTHAYRWQKNSDWSNGLFSDMIFEGLATNVEEFVIKNTPLKTPWKAFKLETEATPELLQQIQKVFLPFYDKYVGEYNYDTFFSFGQNLPADPDYLPVDAGYKLGYHLVKKFLSDKKISVFEADILNYSDFNYLRDFKF